MSIYQQAIDHYGRAHQVTKAIEECAELIQVLAKHGPVTITVEDLQHITEEIADVEIMIEQLKLIYNTDTTLIKQKKIARILNRMNQYEG